MKLKLEKASLFGGEACKPCEVDEKTGEEAGDDQGDQGADNGDDGFGVHAVGKIEGGGDNRTSA